MLLGPLAACERTNHENIDRWMRTEKGPAKLEQTLVDAELAADLRAHAGQNLVRMDSTDKVLAALEALPAADRHPVILALAPRLWDDARIEGELTKPSALQIGAKDALFELRRLADDQGRQAIDGYLIDWLTGGYYAGRAQTGRVRGAAIMRAIGPAAAPRLLDAARSVLAAPPDASGARLKLEDELLVGLAATGSPEAVAFLLDLVGQGERDEKLPEGAVGALYAAFVDNGQRFELADSKALVPHLDRLAALVRDGGHGAKTTNDVIALIGAAGAPACIEPLVGLLAVPLASDQHLWVIANAAVLCGKTQAIVPVAEALPPTLAYEASKLRGVLWEPMAALEDKEAVAAQARTLLESESWVARILGVELLGKLALARSAAEDATRVRALSGDKTVLKGWWGDQDALPKAERKPVPRLGERADEVAKQLDQLAGSGQKS